MAAAVLEATAAHPSWPPTRIASAAGVGYHFLVVLFEHELITITGKGHYGRRLKLTEKGHLFLQNYRVLEEHVPTNGDVHPGGSIPEKRVDRAL
jgi:predicted transcriptional regulator